MSTGVKPRDEESRLTSSDLETIQDAMKNKKFRDLLSEYCEEIRDPANQELYQREMTQLEKERGYNVTFINPQGGYVIKTSVAGDRKAFINICSNDKVDKPTYKVEVVDGRRGMDWQIPYSIIPPREDYDHNKQRCVIYDVVFHPDTLRMAEVNKQFRDLVNKTALDGLKETFNIHLDNNNLRFPKSHYKGMSTPAVIRKEDPNFQAPGEDEIENLSPEMIEKLYPQRNYSENKPTPMKQAPKETPKLSSKHQARSNSEFAHSIQNGYTIPKYVIKQQKNVDLQDYTYHKDSKQYSAIPSNIVVEINLPLLSSTKDCTLDVQDKSLRLISEKPAKYKLDITLPYPVNDECGSATFDKTKHKLIVNLPVVKRNSSHNSNSLKVDSGVESEENSGSQSDEDNNNSNLIVELSSKPTEEPKPVELPSDTIIDTFMDSSISYTLPPYTSNVMDDIVALTFHVKNTDPDSVQVKNDSNEILIRFTSIGSGFVPIHYAAIIIFDNHVKFNSVSGEAWDNNVILQLELAGDVPQKFQIGLSKESMMCEYFDVSQVKKMRVLDEIPEDEAVDAKPVVEVSNLGSETNIVVSSNHSDYDEDDLESPSSEEKDIVFTDLGNCENGAKSILRKPMRSYSESSYGDVASSMDYISSDCIPEESSFKKTVRFSDVIAKQFYRYNSSIEGQKKKNQRKKSKKRNMERRKSESEAEDELNSSSQPSKPRLKSVLKQRRDSGLADTSDAENECKYTPSSSVSTSDNIEDSSTKSVLNIVNNNEKAKEKSEPDIWETNTTKTKATKRMTCDNIKHNTDLYDPDKLNKGHYLEVEFKNDLIFDLDM